MSRNVITLEQLTRLGACKEGLRSFVRLHGEEWDVSKITVEESLIVAKRSGLFSWWLIKRGLLPQIDASGFDLSGRDLSGACLIGANLSNANLIDADLTSAFMLDANLRGANLRGAKTHRARLANAQVSRRTIFPDDFDRAKHKLILIDE